MRLPGLFCVLWLLIAGPISISAQEAPVAPSWIDFVEAKANGTKPLLPDFSYSGYQFSEKEIPDVSGWARFDVTDYGAIPDEEGYDDAGIQAAIDAAEASSEPAVVFFPPGRYIISADNDIEKFITVNRSDIVLKGSGAGDGGTEIFMDKMRVSNGHWQILFRPDRINTQTLTSITEPAERNDFTVTVADVGQLEVGQSVTISHRSLEFAREYYGDLEFSPRWTQMFAENGGMSIHENHLIEHISGNEVTFKNPLQTDLPSVSGSYNIRRMEPLEEVGIEDIRFVGNWPSVGETFVHHKNDIHDYAWNALQFKYVQNAWVRNCEFKDWSQVMDIRESMAVTVENVEVSGKAAHASFLNRRSYGLLIKDFKNTTGGLVGNFLTAPTHHGPGVGFSGVCTVYLRGQLSPGQRIDAHSGSPYASLYDDMSGGNMLKNGGPERFYPHHGRHLVMWNHRHDNAGAPISYNFWQLDRRNNPTYAEPYFVGFQPTSPTTFIGAGLDELHGQEVQPKSLFEAQLQLRLEGATSSQAPEAKVINLTVSPNPAMDVITVTTDREFKQIEVLTMSGRSMSVRSNYFTGQRKATINISKVPAGIYIVRVRTDEGDAFRKVIKR